MDWGKHKEVKLVREVKKEVAIMLTSYSMFGAHIMHWSNWSSLGAVSWCHCCCFSGVGTLPRVAMLASRLHASSYHDVTASSQQTRPAAAGTGSTRRQSLATTKKDCKSSFGCEQAAVQLIEVKAQTFLS